MLNVSGSGKTSRDLDPSIVNAYLANHSLCIVLSNRQKWTVDLSIYYNSAPAAEVLAERTYAARLKIEPKAIRWPNGFRLSIKSILAQGRQEKSQAA